MWGAQSSPFLRKREGTSCHLVAYIRANTSMSVLEKLDFFKLLVWKRAYPFYPIELSHFAEEIKSSSEIPKFHKLRSVVMVS